MTTLQEAAQKALEALRNASALDHSFSSQKQHYEAIESLRTALAQPVSEPVSTCNDTLRLQGKSYPRTCQKCGLGPCIGNTAAPAPQPAQPVAQPLPQEDIQALLDDFLDSSDERLIEFARDIEKAHGIREVK